MTRRELEAYLSRPPFSPMLSDPQSSMLMVIAFVLVDWFEVYAQRTRPTPPEAA